jgi:hypothetical protein
MIHSDAGHILGWVETTKAHDFPSLAGSIFSDEKIII